MSPAVVMIIGLGILAIASGMLGLGVAFAAVPFLSLFLPDLIHQVQPLSLLLNGVTALFSVAGFARSRFIDWPKALVLGGVTTVSAPLGAVLVQRTSPMVVWGPYLASVLYLSYRLFRPVTARPGSENFKLAVVLAVPIAVLSGMLGVGPGFLLLPSLILVGFEPKKAAGINAFAVAPPSFSSLVPHWAAARFDLRLTLILIPVGAAGSFLGARLTSLYVPGGRIKQIFGILIVVMTIYKIATLIL